MDVVPVGELSYWARVALREIDRATAIITPAEKVQVLRHALRIAEAGPPMAVVWGSPEA